MRSGSSSIAPGTAYCVKRAPRENWASSFGRHTEKAPGDRGLLIDSIELEAQERLNGAKRTRGA
jgi:hypothetical protein